MKLLEIKIDSFKKILFFIISLIISFGLFYIDIKLQTYDITLLLPYIILVSFTTLFIGNKTGLFFSILTLLMWFSSKTNLFTTLSLIIYINLMIKSIFVFLQYLLIIYIKKLYFKVEALSLLDELTGLNNRRGFFHLTQYEIIKKKRTKEIISLLFIDIDNFKKINDMKGHKEGDKVLKELSEVIKKTTRTLDISARVGGDEFCVFLPNVDQNIIKKIAKRIIEGFDGSSIRNQWPTSLSIGGFTAKNNIELEELIKRSDDLMYKAKKGGKNRIEYDSL